MQGLWRVLYSFKADVVVNGHEHSYERFMPQNPDGHLDPQQGIREFIVGTGGTALRRIDTRAPNSEVQNDETHGVIEFTLHSTSYDWEFLPVEGQTFRDKGSATCVGENTP